MSSFYFSNALETHQYFFQLLLDIINILVNRLKDVKPSIEKPHISLNSFCYASKVILRFAFHTSCFPGESFHLFLQLIDRLLLHNETSFQPNENYLYFLQLFLKIIHINPTNSQLIKILLRVVKFKQNSLRCLGSASIFHVFMTDFQNNHSILLSSSTFLNNFTETVFEDSLTGISTYQLLINRLLFLAEVSGDSNFLSLLTEKMKSFQVILNANIKQKTNPEFPEFHCLTTMKVADLYKQTPSMRIQWLREIVSINQKIPNFISALVAQLHIVAIIAKILYLLSPRKNKFPDNFSPHFLIVQPLLYSHFFSGQTVPFHYSEFEIFPSLKVETSIDFGEIMNHIEDFKVDFSIHYLQSHLKQVSSLATKANLNYPLRVIFSFLIRIAHFSNNYGELSFLFKQFSASIGSFSNEIYTDPDESSIFYLFESAKKDVDIRPYVYCVQKTQEKTFVNWLNQKIQFEREPEKMTEISRYPNSSCKLCENHTQNCEGVCVIIISKIYIPRNKPEYSLHQKKFRTSVTLEQYRQYDFTEKIILCHEYTTADIFPNYRICSAVVKDKIIPFSVLDVVKDRTIFDQYELDLIYNHLSKMNDNVNSEFQISLTHITPVIKRIFLDPNSSVQSILILNENLKSKAQKLMRKIRDGMICIFQVLSRFKSDLYISYLDLANKYFTQLSFDPVLQFYPQFSQQFQNEMGIE